MPPRHGHVVEKDVAVRMAANQREVAVQQEPAACVAPAPHDQHGRSGRERVEHRGIGNRLVADFQWQKQYHTTRGGGVNIANCCFGGLPRGRARTSTNSGDEFSFASWKLKMPMY